MVARYYYSHDILFYERLMPSAQNWGDFPREVCLVFGRAWFHQYCSMGDYTLKLIDNDVDRIYFDLEASFVIVRSNRKIFEQITINILVNLNESPPPISRKGH